MWYRYAIVLAFTALLGFVSVARAEDAKTVTLKGTMECAKCVLHEGAECQSVLLVKEGDQTTKYYLTDNTLSKDSHAAVCKTAKEDVTITGTLEDKDGKHYLTATKIEGLPEEKK